MNVKYKILNAECKSNLASTGELLLLYFKF